MLGVDKINSHKIKFVAMRKCTHLYSQLCFLLSHWQIWQITGKYHCLQVCSGGNTECVQSCDHIVMVIHSAAGAMQNIHVHV